MKPNNLKKARLKSKLTLAKLSQLSGVSISSIADIENNRTMPGTDKAQLLVEAVGADLYDVFDYRELF